MTLFQGFRLPKKAQNGALFTSVRGRKEMTEAALKRDAARRKEGSGPSPFKQGPINLTVQEERG